MINSDKDIGVVGGTDKLLSLISEKTKLVVESVRPIIDVTNQCSKCGKFYNDNDVALLEDRIYCFNCIDLAKSYWRRKFLKSGFTAKTIDKLLIRQYGLTVRP